jgi:hypothetical protein
MANLKSVLGPSPLLWLWPQRMRGDGLSYPVNPDAGGESAGAEWAGLVAPQPVETYGGASGSQAHMDGSLRSRSREEESMA